MFTLSGLAWKALENFSSEDRRAASACFRSVMSWMAPVSATGCPASSHWSSPVPWTQRRSPSEARTMG